MSNICELIKERRLLEGLKAEEIASEESIENLENGIDGKIDGMELRKTIL